MGLTTGQLAERTGLTPDAVRFYERAGLLPPPDRTASNYRSFDEGHVERIKLVKGAQRLGLRLREIRDLLAIMDRGLCPCGHAERVVIERVAEVDAEIARLRALRERLAGLLDRFVAPDRRDGSAAEDGEDAWPCRLEFVRAGGGDPS